MYHIAEWIEIVFFFSNYTARQNIIGRYYLTKDNWWHMITSAVLACLIPLTLLSQFFCRWCSLYTFSTVFTSNEISYDLAWFAANHDLNIENICMEVFIMILSISFSIFDVSYYINNRHYLQYFSWKRKISWSNERNQINQGVVWSPTNMLLPITSNDTSNPSLQKCNTLKNVCKL